ncbi:Kinesin-like protein KIN-12C [Frankliniella fusca]|uniref:Kinesin-like protein KIN-12C n=1 Tax=Frankliniella fusca TaxID=407009 RepID=A0AAE1HP98_9NEOP|nr:Kinesin-like protein KIN-12C [Frankliniella fusca]
MSGVGFFAAVKSMAPSSIRRKRRSLKQQRSLQLPDAPAAAAASGSGSGSITPDVVPTWDTAVPPITPPAAFKAPPPGAGPGSAAAGITHEFSGIPHGFLGLKRAKTWLMAKTINEEQ